MSRCTGLRKCKGGECVRERRVHEGSLCTKASEVWMMKNVTSYWHWKLFFIGHKLLIWLNLCCVLPVCFLGFFFMNKLVTFPNLLLGCKIPTPEMYLTFVLYIQWFSKVHVFKKKKQIIIVVLSWDTMTIFSKAYSILLYL